MLLLDSIFRNLNAMCDRGVPLHYIKGNNT